MIKAKYESELYSLVRLYTYETPEDFNELYVFAKAYLRQALRELACLSASPDSELDWVFERVRKGINNFLNVGAQEKHRTRSARLSSRKRYKEQPRLTITEKEILEAVARGLGDAEIAKLRNVNKRTIEQHLYNMLSKTRLPNRTALAVWAIQNDIVQGVNLMIPD